ncbi:hypothetical protein [Luteibacter sp. SG786]|uniref:hypothetical protein n=1 Tax=Luteibacter sp. SG786 TaxID=2587130 RepID=UPI0014202AFF|nr:hypothetical protein [Luteibacter sp. SG786]NII54403.1 hypothetical protein [Luteibacter sp. SG786]
MGGGGNDAAKQAQRAEEQRQRNIQASTGKVNAVFNDPSRTAQYDQLAKDTTAFYRTDLDRQKAETDRNLRFSLARSGLVGGSVQADQNRKVGEDYLKGVIEATRRGAAAGADLRAQDETSRANLIAMAQNGLDATTAANNAAQALRSNLESGRATATANAFGDAFGDFAGIYKQSQDAAALRAGQKYAYNTLYQPGFGYGGRQ